VTIQSKIQVNAVSTHSIGAPFFDRLQHRLAGEVLGPHGRQAFTISARIAEMVIGAGDEADAFSAGQRMLQAAFAPATAQRMADVRERCVRLFRIAVFRIDLENRGDGCIQIVQVGAAVSLTIAGVMGNQQRFIIKGEFFQIRQVFEDDQVGAVVGKQDAIVAVKA